MPRCTVAGDRGFESISLLRGVTCEPELSVSVHHTQCLGGPRKVGGLSFYPGNACDRRRRSEPGWHVPWQGAFEIVRELRTVLAVLRLLYSRRECAGRVQTELSRLIAIEQPTMAITLRRMERDGIIERSPDPEHGRKSLVKLTAHGRRLSDVIAAAAHDVQKVASKGLTTAELDEFYRLVDLMTENLSAERHG